MEEVRTSHDRQALFAQARTVLRGLLVINAVFLVVVASLCFTTYREDAVQVALYFLFVEALLGVFWFVPVLGFHWLYRGRGLAESSALAVLSFAQALGLASPS